MRGIGCDFFPIKKANQWFKLISPKKRRRTDKDFFFGSIILVAKRLPTFQKNNVKLIYLVISVYYKLDIILWPWDS